MSQTDIPCDPSYCQRRISEAMGQAGRDWLARLPRHLADCARRWRLTILPPFPVFSYNYVAPVVRADGSPAVLKTGVPNPELWGEMAELALLDGRGIARLIDIDRDLGAMLQERLQPGDALSTSVSDEMAIDITAAIFEQLWQPAPPDPALTTVARWASGFSRLRARFDGGTGPLPDDWIAQAERLFARLLAEDDQPPCLLHGDLHTGNILASQRGWLAIDPKGVTGSRYFDAGLFFNSLFFDFGPGDDPAATLARRAERIAARLGLERARLLDWAIGHAALSGFWSFEDHGRGWEENLEQSALTARVRAQFFA